MKSHGIGLRPPRMCAHMSVHILPQMMGAVAPSQGNALLNDTPGLNWDLELPSLGTEAVTKLLRTG